MKEFKVTNGKTNLVLNLPTSLNEITPEYLTSVTSHIEVAPYHAIIGIVYRCKLPELVSTNKKSRAMSMAIVPVYVKGNLANSTEDMFSLFNNIKTGDKLIIAGTDIERGYHVTSTRNRITIDNVLAIYKNDNNFAKNIITDQNYYYFVEFKMVPVNDIKGYYKDKFEDDDSFVNPFIKIEENKEQD